MARRRRFNESVAERARKRLEQDERRRKAEQQRQKPSDEENCEAKSNGGKFDSSAVSARMHILSEDEGAQRNKLSSNSTSAPVSVLLSPVDSSGSKSNSLGLKNEASFSSTKPSVPTNNSHDSPISSVSMSQSQSPSRSIGVRGIAKACYSSDSDAADSRKRPSVLASRSRNARREFQSTSGDRVKRSAPLDESSSDESDVDCDGRRRCSSLSLGDKLDDRISLPTNTRQETQSTVNGKGDRGCRNAEDSDTDNDVSPGHRCDSHNAAHDTSIERQSDDSPVAQRPQPFHQRAKFNFNRQYSSESSDDSDDEHTNKAGRHKAGSTSDEDDCHPKASPKRSTVSTSTLPHSSRKQSLEGDKAPTQPAAESKERLPDDEIESPPKPLPFKKKGIGKKNSSERPRRTSGTRKSGGTKNPLAYEQREKEKNAILMNHLPGPSASDDVIWDSDDDNARTATSRHISNARAQDYPPRLLALDDDDERQVSSGDGVPAVVLPRSGSDGASESEIDSSSDDEEESNEKPDFPNPTFGPFANEPMILNNSENFEGHQVPASISRFLPDFQREGIQFIYKAISSGNGVVLGDDMGLGKTVQVLSLVAALLGKRGTLQDKRELKKRVRKVKEYIAEKKKRGDTALELGHLSGRERIEEDLLKKFKKDILKLPAMLPILLVVPASVVDNWNYEFKLWGHFRVELYRDELDRTLALESINYGSAEVLLCGHSMFSSSEHFEEFIKIPWKLVVVDEFHVFKNIKGTLSMNLRRLTQEYRCPVLGMTGTPMQNDFDE
jgi:hypothetical protein